MRIKMDSHLVEPLDLDVDATSQKKNKKKQMGSEQPSRKHPRSESDHKDGNKGNLPSAMETSRKKQAESSHLPNVNTNVDIAAEEKNGLRWIHLSQLPIEAAITYLLMIPPKKSLLHQANYHLMG
ncbi:hypothetical protein R1flu_025076 [Riccia fluitans]|uniref:Uncharacterized protein n=1 Tax=Riccia fluitans TaxID=41844 RepID=A0ABD1XWQ4_9MARC